MNNKIVSTKRTSAIFLAIVLVTGTIALSAPSFMIGAVQAQPYYYDGGMYNRYDDSKSYGNDNSYESQYQSYKPDYYKPEYPSYDGKDNRDKSKDIKNIDINKLNCINTNININGNNTGDINLGNKGAAEGYLGGYSSGDGEGYYDGYNKKKDKGSTCIINNNNNNTNIVTGGGNVTDGGGNITEPQTCEECFERFLTEDQISGLEGSSNLEDYCNAVESGVITEGVLRTDLAELGVSEANIDALIACLESVGLFAG